MKNYKAALGLIIVLAIVGGVIYWDEWKTKKDEQDKKQENKLLTLNKDHIVKINFFARINTASPDRPETEKNQKSEQPKEVAATLEKKEGNWYLISPVQSKADNSTVDNLLTTLIDFNYSKVIAEGKDKWPEYGLDLPKSTIELTTNDNQKDTVYIGNEAPVGYSAYLRKQDSEKILLGSQHILTSTNKTLKDFRDKSLVDLDQNDINYVVYEYQNKTKIVIEKVDGKFRFADYKDLEIDEDEVRKFLGDLVGIKVEEFYDQPDTKLKTMFKTPFYTIHWRESKGREKSLMVATRDQELLATFDPNLAIFKISSNSKDKLEKKILDFQNKKIFAFNSAEVKSTNIDGLEFEKADGDWYKKEDVEKVKNKDEKDKPKTKQHVQNLMVDLEFAETDMFVETNSAASKDLLKSPPQHKITITFKEDKNMPPLEVKVWKDLKTADKFILQSSQKDKLFRVDKAVIANVTEQPDKNDADQDEDTLEDKLN